MTSSLFIGRLSEVYAEYKDLIQPVQIAIYEMKFGLSLAISGAVEREYLKKVDEENCQRILVCDDCTFMLGFLSCHDFTKFLSKMKLLYPLFLCYQELVHSIEISKMNRDFA